MAACTKSEVVELNKGNEISLTAVTGKNLTKAADGYCNKAKPHDFQVWASTTSDPKVYFKNETYTDYSGTYKSATAHYWPEEHLDFFAAKNHNGTVTFDPTAAVPFTVEGYTVNSDVTAQTDFIYAVSKNVTKPAGGKTNLNFRHALSQIEFKAKNENKNIYVYIDGVKVVNVKNTGNFLIDKATTGNFDHNTTESEADTRPDGTRGTWSAQSGTQTYTVSLGSKKPVAAGTPTVPVNLTHSDSDEYTTNSMYLLPQSLTVWNGSGKAKDSSDAYFIVKALIYNVADPNVTFVPDDNVVLWGDKSSGTWETKEIAVQIPNGTTWQDGLRYVYTFNFTTYGTGGTDPGTGDKVLTPITLEVTVDDFVDAGNTDVEVK